MAVMVIMPWFSLQSLATPIKVKAKLHQDGFRVHVVVNVQTLTEFGFASVNSIIAEITNFVKKP
jgi:hypothetical protein